ncbi:RNA-dependent RNA polymerase [Erysiphe necator associated narnavirus 49]|nr:RNA-dependent RNA polymerase [Erysiphe necator associated narnavirus 49]
MTLRKAGSRLSKDVSPFLMEEGFFRPTMDSQGEGESMLEHFSTDTEDHLIFEEDADVDIPFADISDDRGIYEDPFRIFAGWAFASQYRKDKPLINVWPGGCHRIQDKIRPDLCQSDRKHVTWFTKIRDHKEKMFFLFNHTHWGHRLQRARHAKSSGEDPLRNFANTLFRRISFFVRGLHDPIWTKEETSRFADYSEPRNSTYRAQRLLEVLKTVDGLFLQRFMSYPEELWTWEKFDLYTVQAISILITDEFFDGEVSTYSLDEQVTHYELLKQARKKFKMVIHQDEPSRAILDMDSTPRWVQSFLRPVWDRAVRHEGFSRLYLAGTLSQTRGSGTPPPLVVLRSKRKFLRSVQEAPPDITKTQSGLIQAAFNDVMEALPDHIFTGLDSKARVTVTGSACWEANRREGGTAQAVLSLMEKYEHNPIPVRDLDTGKVIKFVNKDDFESVGTGVFHACLDEVLNTSPQDLREVHLTIVREPGKARVVTKGRAALKIVLDTVSKICSYPLKKGIKSSTSGMGRSHHGWNLFRDMTSEEMYDLLFSEDRKRRVEDTFHDHVDRTMYWEDLYFSSTDYSEATDRMVHHFARIIGRGWMKKCGIPGLLQGIVLAVCFHPRTVHFTATGPLSDIGTLVEGTTRQVTLYRGVLMGDPLTKVILHFANIISRKIGEAMASGDLFRSFRNSSEASEEFIRGCKLPIPM